MEGNEQVNPNKCESCHEIGLESVAIFYCYECSKRKCNSCKTKHSRSRSTRRHRLIQIHDVPVGVSLVCLSSLQTCLKHPNEEFAFLCVSHNELCCSICASQTHKECDIKSVIDEINDTNAHGNDNTIVEKFDQLRTSINTVLQEQDKRSERFDALKDSFNAKLDTLKHTINKVYDDFSVKTSTSFEQKHRQMINRMKELRRIVTNKEYVARKIKELLVYSIDSKDNVKAYMARRELAKQVEELEQAIDVIKSDEKVDFHIPDITPLKSALNDVLNVKDTDSSSNSDNNTLTTCDSKSSRDAVLTHTQPVDDRNAFNDCTWLNDEHIVLIDSGTKKLYSFIVPQNSIEELLTFPTLPWCVEGLDIDTVVVTFHAERMIRFVRVVPGEATILKEVYIFEMCFGIQYDPTEMVLYILCKSLVVKLAEIRKFSLGGEHLGTFEIDDEATTKLQTAYSFLITKDRSSLIIGCGTNDVVFINLREGHIVLKYDPILSNPVFVTIDNNGNIYVVWNTNSTIHMLTSDGDFIREVLTGNDGLALPSRMYFNKTCDKFVIIDQYRRRQIKLYNYI